MGGNRYRPVPDRKDLFGWRAFSAPGLTAVVFWATASKPADRDTAKKDKILLTIVDEVIVLEKPKKRLARRASLL